jgi:hypothetical protein
MRFVTFLLIYLEDDSTRELAFLHTLEDAIQLIMISVRSRSSTQVTLTP